MGGNIFEGTSRVNRTVYIIIKFIIFKTLETWCDSKFPFNRVDKVSHGDIDVLYVSKSGKSICDLIVSLFNTTDINVNGPIFSFALSIGKHKYHIDMIDCFSYGIDTAHFYLSYGDVGNILGMILSKYNLHIGFQGLFVKKKIGGTHKESYRNMCFFES